MATSVWKGYLSFGLISIPIRLFPAARTERIGLNQLHNVFKTRIRMPWNCPQCERRVPRNEIVKGYEYEKDQYVLFDEEELDKIEPQSARAMEILEFVKVDEIDPLYFAASYYVPPHNKIREVAEYGKMDAASEPKPAEKKLAEQLIESLAAPFEPDKYKDNYMESMKAMIEAKQQGQEIATAAPPNR